MLRPLLLCYYYDTGAARKRSGALHGKKASSIPFHDLDTSYTFSKTLREILLARVGINYVRDVTALPIPLPYCLYTCAKHVAHSCYPFLVASRLPRVGQQT
jgi:hypothetical protein